jgi:hypothetical protein
MCHVRLIGPPPPVGVGAVGTAAVAGVVAVVAAVVGAVAVVGAAAVGAASAGAAAVGTAAVGVAVAGVAAVGVAVGVVGNLLAAVEVSFFDLRQRAVRTRPRNSLTSPNKWGRAERPQVRRLQCS